MKIKMSMNLRYSHKIFSAYDATSTQEMSGNRWLCIKCKIQGMSVNYLIVAVTPKTSTGKINRIQLRKLYD